MADSAITNFEKLLASGKDSALLRFGLGSEYLKRGDAGMASAHLREAVRQDADYSAAWKLLGRALTELGQWAEALSAYRHGMDAAEHKGDKQALKEMQVFARRLEKRLG